MNSSRRNSVNGRLHTTWQHVFSLPSFESNFVDLIRSLSCSLLHRNAFLFTNFEIKVFIVRFQYLAFPIHQCHYSKKESIPIYNDLPETLSPANIWKNSQMKNPTIVFDFFFLLPFLLSASMVRNVPFGKILLPFFLPFPPPPHTSKFNWLAQRSAESFLLIISLVCVLMLNEWI